MNTKQELPAVANENEVMLHSLSDGMKELVAEIEKECEAMMRYALCNGISIDSDCLTA